MEQFSQNNKIAIVGAGPCGIYCALQILSIFSSLNFFDYSINIFDKSQVLRTILPTGGGRCNLTNSIVGVREFCSNYPRGEKFFYSLFSRHSNFDTLEFFKNIKIDSYTQSDGRVFPKSNSSKDVKDKMISALLNYKNVKLMHKEIKSKCDLSGFDRIIIACGTHNGHNLITEFNHTYIPFKKALCSLNLDNFIYPKGVSVKALDGEFIFTDTGISGPLAYKISSLNVLKTFPYRVKITLFNAADLLFEANNNPKKSILKILSKFIPRSLALCILKNPQKNCAEISKEELISYSVLNLKIISSARHGEVVNAGGVELDELDKNCKSKLVKNLWYCGEILNIDGFCGGFNLQNCWSSAFVVANDVVSSIMNI